MATKLTASGLLKVSADKRRSYTIESLLNRVSVHLKMRSLMLAMRARMLSIVSRNPDVLAGIGSFASSCLRSQNDNGFDPIMRFDRTLEPLLRLQEGL